MKLKNLSVFVIILTFALLFTSCGGSGNIEITLGPDDNTEPTSRDNVYFITINNVSIAPHDDLTAVIPALGQYVDYEESNSCAYIGLDKVYVYNGYTIYTYPENGVDYLSSLELTDDSLTTDEGVRISDSSAKVIEKYGSGYTDSSGTWTYSKGKTILQFDIANGVVKGIRFIADSE